MDSRTRKIQELEAKNRDLQYRLTMARDHVRATVHSAIEALNGNYYQDRRWIARSGISILEATK